MCGKHKINDPVILCARILGLISGIQLNLKITKSDIRSITALVIRPALINGGREPLDLILIDNRIRQGAVDP